MEHRHHPRRLAELSAFLYDPHGFIYPCLVDNISSNGIFIKMTETRVNKGSYVKLAINISPRIASQITANGLIVHKEEDGIGLLIEDDFPFQELFKDT